MVKNGWTASTLIQGEFRVNECRVPNLIWPTDIWLQSLSQMPHISIHLNTNQICLYLELIIYMHSQSSRLKRRSERFKYASLSYCAKLPNRKACRNSCKYGEHSSLCHKIFHQICLKFWSSASEWCHRDTLWLAVDNQCNDLRWSEHAWQEGFEDSIPVCFIDTTAGSSMGFKLPQTTYLSLSMHCQMVSQAHLRKFDDKTYMQLMKHGNCYNVLAFVFVIFCSWNGQSICLCLGKWYHSNWRGVSINITAAKKSTDRPRAYPTSRLSPELVCLHIE